MSERSVGDRPGESGGESGETARKKVAAVCTSCGTGYAAEEWADGTIRPIGQRNGCQCGGTSFDVLDGPKTEPSASR